MAEAFRKIRESAEGSKAHVRLDSLSQTPIDVDMNMRNTYLRRFNRMTRALTDAGDSNTVMFANKEGGMELPRAKFASMVFDLRTTIVSMGAGNLADRITTYYSSRSGAFRAALSA